MAKDPAVLFYTNDFLSGTFTMTDEQVGKYMRLLCIQHQKGFLTEKDMLNICKTYDEDIYSKFDVKDGKYVNKRMQEEADRRKRYSESRRENRKNSNSDEKLDDKGKDKNNISDTYDKHMETETENITEIEIEGEKKVAEKINFDLVLEHWNMFAEKMDLPKIKAITEGRKKKILTRSREKDFNFIEILNQIYQSDFLLGKINGFKVSFDWIFESEKNYLKILEGNYKNAITTKINTADDKGFDPRKNTWIGTIKNRSL